MKNDQKNQNQTEKPNELERYKELLSDAGLSEKEVLIYNYLLENNASGAGDIIRSVNLKRGDAYNHIYSLLQKGLISKRTINGRMKFSLEPPINLDSYIESRSRAIVEAQKGLQAVMPTLLSTYNLSYHKPGVKVFEGEDAINKVLSDSLSSRTEICEYLDPSEVDTFLEKPNKKYIAKRLENKIIKKILVPDTPFTKERYKGKTNRYSQISTLNFQMPKFQTVMQIYDNKISYLTLTEGNMIGVIIEDPFIYKMHKALFEVSWSSANRI